MILKQKIATQILLCKDYLLEFENLRDHISLNDFLRAKCCHGTSFN